MVVVVSSTDVVVDELGISGPVVVVGAWDVVVVALARVVATDDGRSVTWSRTSATACDASAIATAVAAIQPAMSPSRRVFMATVWTTMGSYPPKQRLRVG